MGVDFGLDVDFGFWGKSRSTEIYSLQMSISVLSEVIFYWKMNISSTEKPKPKRSWIWRSVCLLFETEICTKPKPKARQKSTSTEIYPSEVPAYSNTLGTWEKCHCKQIVTVTRGSLVTNASFGTCQKCHCKRGVTVNSVTVSGEICSKIPF